MGKGGGGAKGGGGGGGKGKGKGKGGGAASAGGASAAAEKKGCLRAKVRHILCEQHAAIVAAQDALAAGGQSFADVARARSEDKARAGGDLGWVQRQGLDPAFAERAFAQPIGVPSEIFRTRHGYHILLVEKRE